MSSVKSIGTRLLVVIAMLLVSPLATRALAQTAAQTSAPNSSNAAGVKPDDGPSAKPAAAREGRETRGVIDSKPTYCDVDPPCPPYCREDPVNKICVVKPKAKPRPQ